VRRSLAWRTLLSLGLAGSLTAQAVAGPARGHAATGGASSVSLQHELHGLTPLTPEQAQALSRNADQRVSIVFKDQYAGLPARGTTRTQRMNAIATAQSPVMAELNQVGATSVHPFKLINAVAATISSAEVDRLKADPAVQAVVPDRIINPPAHSDGDNGPAAGSIASQAMGGTGPCTSSVSLEPEALQLTNTAFDNPALPQAQNVRDGAGNPILGTGVKVAFFAEGIDINNPEFTRNGQSIFADYKDFTGDGPNAPTDGGEAFLDASSIAAQGNNVYDVSKPVSAGGAGLLVNPAVSTASCRIRIRGMAPGVSLYGMKVFPKGAGQYNTVLAQAVEYAVLVDNVDILSISIGGFAFPDNQNDPFRLAIDAAVAAGKPAFLSSGDQGVFSTLGTPSTDPNVIQMGGTTSLRAYAEAGFNGIQLGNGDYVSNNTSPIASSGFAQAGGRSVDAVAASQFGFIACTPSAIYASCTDIANQPSQVNLVGGTSESAPLGAGEAALIFQAYRSTHGGANPSPTLVKQIIKGTAQDLGAPVEEQGAPDGSGTLVATDLPGTPESLSFQITNSGRATEVILPGFGVAGTPGTPGIAGLSGRGASVQTLGTPFYSATFTQNLNPATAPTFFDRNRSSRSYVEQDFALPRDGQRLDVTLAANVASQPRSILRFSLFGPDGRFLSTNFPSNPVGTGFGHASVTNPRAGTYRLILFTNTTGSSSFSGPINISIGEANFVTAGRVIPAPGSVVLGPGQTKTFTVRTTMPSQPGDSSAKVVLRMLSLGDVNPTRAYIFRTTLAVPIILRTLVPVGTTGGSFSGTLAGSNGLTPAQIATYAFTVPAGLRDLNLSLSDQDASNQLFGYLVDPNGLPVNQQSNIASIDPKTFAASFVNTIQFFRRDPLPGVYRFILQNNGATGGLTANPFTVNVAFNTVNVTSSGVPNSPSATLPYSQPTTIQVNVTNTGNSTKDFFVEPRLTQNATFAVRRTVVITDPAAQFAAPGAPLPPAAFVPTESSAVAATASASVPIRFELDNNETNTPNVPSVSAPGPDASGNYTASASFSAPPAAPTTGGAPTSAVPSGLYVVIPSQVGPFTGPAAPVTVAITGSITTQRPDANATTSSGDPEFAASYTPLTLAPGQSGTITVTFFPTRRSGTVVQGNLYVNAATGNTGALGGTITDPVDELVAIPYQYTVGPGNP